MLRALRKASDRSGSRGALVDAMRDDLAPKLERLHTQWGEAARDACAEGYSRLVGLQLGFLGRCRLGLSTHRLEFTWCWMGAVLDPTQLDSI